MTRVPSVATSYFGTTRVYRLCYHVVKRRQARRKGGRAMPLIPYPRYRCDRNPSHESGITSAINAPETMRCNAPDCRGTMRKIAT